MHALVLLCIYQHPEFEVPSFTNSKKYDWGKILKKESHDPDHAN